MAYRTDSGCSTRTPDVAPTRKVYLTSHVSNRLADTQAEWYIHKRDIGADEDSTKRVVDGGGGHDATRQGTALGTPERGRHMYQGARTKFRTFTAIGSPTDPLAAQERHDSRSRSQSP